MNTKDYGKLTKEYQYYLRRLFFENNTNKCCRLCDSMIDGFCYTSKLWCTNVSPEEKECFRIRNCWNEFLEKYTKEDFNNG